MSKNRLCLFAALTFLGVMASQGASAQTYLGAEVGSARLSFQPEYSFANGGPNTSFDNQANGMTAGVLWGYRGWSEPGFSLDVQGRFSASNADWQLTLPEPASFKYDIPYDAALTLLPTLRVTEKLGLFGEGGVALGYIREVKSAVSTSMYDSKTWRPGVVAGIGLNVALDEGWAMRMAYRRTWYQGHTFDTYLSDGATVETVRSHVSQSTATMSLIRAF